MGRCRAMRHKSQKRIEYGDVDACKVWECVVECKDFGGLCTRENLELSSQRIEHQDHLNSCESETQRRGGK